MNLDVNLVSFFLFSKLAAGGETKGNPSLRWPTPSDLNTRLRRIIAGYQRVVKKAELKKAAAEKVKNKLKKERGFVFWSYFFPEIP